MTADAETNSSPEPKRIRILVAEDSPLNLQVALMQLAKLGYEADSATDGTEVLEAVGRAPYDIILMDCQMPEVSGYEATWQIREQEKQRATDVESPRQTYIIAMTANSEADHRTKCETAGMDDFILKPVQLPELEAALHRAMADRAAQQALEEILDPVIIAGLRQLKTPNKPNPLGELIDLFLKEAPTRLTAIENAIAANDINAMSKTISAATALKGSAGNLGARRLAALCDEIEQSAKAGCLPDAQPVLDAAKAEFDVVREMLEKVKTEATASRA